jgi:hypothetical protein
MKLINGSTYWHGTDRISKILKVCTLLVAQLFGHLNLEIAGPHKTDISSALCNTLL